jgi:hypothetical protein
MEKLSLCFYTYRSKETNQPLFSITIYLAGDSCFIESNIPKIITEDYECLLDTKQIIANPDRQYEIAEQNAEIIAEYIALYDFFAPYYYIPSFFLKKGSKKINWKIVFQYDEIEDEVNLGKNLYFNENNSFHVYYTDRLYHIVNLSFLLEKFFGEFKQISRKKFEKQLITGSVDSYLDVYNDIHFFVQLISYSSDVPDLFLAKDKFGKTKMGLIISNANI